MGGHQPGKSPDLSPPSNPSGASSHPHPWTHQRYLSAPELLRGSLHHPGAPISQPGDKVVVLNGPKSLFCFLGALKSLGNFLATSCALIIPWDPALWPCFSVDCWEQHVRGRVSKVIKGFDLKKRGGGGISICCHFPTVGSSGHSHQPHKGSSRTKRHKLTQTGAGFGDSKA